MATKTDIRQYLKKKGSPLAAYTNELFAAANKYRVDPRLIVAIAGAESSFGKYLSGSFNAWGIGPGYSYSSWTDGINAAAKLLREGYLGEGLTSLRQIQGKWAPIGASNDPRNLNSAWLRNTSAFYQELGGRDSGKVADWRKDASPAAKPNVEFTEVSESVLDVPKLGSVFDPDAPTLMDVALGHVSPTELLPGLLAESEAEVAKLDEPKMPSIPQAAPVKTPLVGGDDIADMDHLNPAMSALAKQFGMTVTSGFRSVSKQAQLYAGRSGPGTVGAPGQSYHNYGRAIDVAPNQASMRFVEYARKNPHLFREVFWDGKNSIYIKNGKLYPGRRLGGHSDHVHIAR